MIAVLQRVYNATVYSDEVLTGSIADGLYILLGVKNTDSDKDAELLAEKISKTRIFSDENGKLNLSVKDTSSAALVVPNFTLCANYAHGNRPEYFSAAKPEEASRLFDLFVAQLRLKLDKVDTGVFGSHMRTVLSTNGPITIVMNSEELNGGKR